MEVDDRTYYARLDVVPLDSSKSTVCTAATDLGASGRSGEDAALARAGASVRRSVNRPVNGAVRRSEEDM